MSVAGQAEIKQMAALNEAYFQRVFGNDGAKGGASDALNLAPQWDGEVLGDENARSWPQSARQQNEDALAATFFRKPRRMEF